MSISTDESIYNLIPEVPPPEKKPPRHKSKFSESVKMEVKRNKSPDKTMGPAKVVVNSPNDYLRKHSKEPKLTGDSTFKYPDSDSRKPSVPKHTEKPQMGTTSSKNFISTNVATNVTAVPKKPTPKYVDTAMGDRFDLEKSGLVPKYLKKKEYGEVPAYLKQREQEMTEAQAEYDRLVKESLEKEAMAQLNDTKREEILEGLKKNWDDLHKQYQGLSVVTDTISKKARKEWMESQMRQLEHDIDTIERHRIVYVAKPEDY
ncbi:hypothetical protein EMCRGX_G013791 [Ephydatia muelleri]|eukprot:Em0004g1360a